MPTKYIMRKDQALNIVLKRLNYVIGLKRDLKKITDYDAGICQSIQYYLESYLNLLELYFNLLDSNKTYIIN